MARRCLDNGISICITPRRRYHACVLNDILAVLISRAGEVNNQVLQLYRFETFSPNICARRYRRIHIKRILRALSLRANAKCGNFLKLTPQYLREISNFDSCGEE